MKNRYDIAGAQGRFEPGSSDTVLANRLGISDPFDIADAELVLLQQLYQAVLVEAFPDRRLTVQDLKDWHRRWLGNVYDWAGEERSVNMSKGDFHFAAAAQVSRLLQQFEQACLVKYTPCHGLAIESLIEAIAVTHVELILIYPFREGNGRPSRLLSDVMAVQAGVGPLDYSAWDQDRNGYFAAIQYGAAMNYAPMANKVRQALGRI